MDDNHIAQLLSDRGYNHITNLHKNGSDWVGSATNQNGQPVNFDIDKDGNILTK